MSRFFRAGESDTDDTESDFSEELTDSELSDSDQSDSDSEESDDDSKPKNRFAFGASDDSDESEDEVRVVRSAKDKRFDEIEQAVTTMSNAQKIGDWVSVQNEFDKANKALQKAASIIAQNGVPKFYIKAVAELEKAIQSAQEKEKSASKKMNASNSKALNSMKQKVKKNNRLYETEIAEYEKDPEAYDAEEEEEEVTVVKTKKSKKAKKAMPESDEEEQEEEEEGDDGFTTVGAKGKAVDYSQENLFKRLREVNDARGKKNTDREEQARILERLLTVASTPYQKIRVLLALISAQFDFAIGLSGYMAIPLWKTAYKHLNSLLVILENNPNFVVQESVPETDEDLDKDLSPSTPDEIIYVQGSVVAFVDRLDDEFIKSLQNIDPHTPDYVDRLKDEVDMYTIIVRSLAYFKRRELTDSICRTTMRRIEHLYFKPEAVILACEKATAEKLPAKVAKATTDSSALIHELCVYLYKNGASLLRTRAMLCHVYHHALHNRFYVARDMLLMSHLQETIFQADITTQIAHNRTMVQLGLCAFRQGMIKEAHACLQDISGTGRVKELLAQGLQLQRYGNATPEQEKLERQRQLPFHMHINLELLECVYLTCSMLLDIPSMSQAGSSLDARKKVISKPFRRMLDYNSRQVFTGPPENTRDHIMGAAKAMANGEWQKSCELINAIKIWDLMPETEKIKEMLGRKIQEEALRTYLFSNAPYYSSIGLEQLAKMFELTVANVNSIVSKMIWGEELSASIDQVSNVVVLHRVEHSKLQALALAFAEKAAGFVESNEKLLESKTPQQNERPKKGGPNAGKDQASGKQQQQRTMGHQPRGGRGRNQFNNGLGNSVRGSRK
ncbi:Translation initiation factor 3 subunit c [Actinomortierella ambigua]|nr:Translation initiation factor 3 subunit c [Actinomortierella ambigua]